MTSITPKLNSSFITVVDYLDVQSQTWPIVWRCMMIKVPQLWCRNFIPYCAVKLRRLRQSQCSWRNIRTASTRLICSFQALRLQKWRSDWGMSAGNTWEGGEGEKKKILDTHKLLLQPEQSGREAAPESHCSLFVVLAAAAGLKQTKLSSPVLFREAGLGGWWKALSLYHWCY